MFQQPVDNADLSMANDEIDDDDDDVKAGETRSCMQPLASLDHLDFSWYIHVS